MFCLPFSFVFTLCFFPSIFVLTPNFSLFLLLTLFFSYLVLPIFSLCSHCLFSLFFPLFFPPTFPLVLIAISCPSLPCFFGWSKKFNRHWTLGLYQMVTEKIRLPSNIPPPWDNDWNSLIAQEVKWGMNFLLSKMIAYAPHPYQLPSNDGGISNGD